MKKRVLSLLLTLSMVFALLPTASVPALAADVTGDGYAFTESTKTLDITTDAGLTGWHGIASTIVNVNIGSSVTSGVTADTFSNCSALKKIEVDAGNVTYSAIGGVLFTKDGTKLWRYPQAKADAAYTVPTGVTSIEQYAFRNCMFLENLTLSEGVTTIGIYAFNGVTALKTVTIPASVTTFEMPSSSYSPPFYNCTSLETITVAEENTAFQSIAGVLFSEATGTATTLLKYPEGKAGTTYTVPNNTTTIGEEAFLANNKLTAVTLPNTVTAINDSAFNTCKKLQTVQFSPELKTIGSSAFRGCIALEKITIPSKVTAIGSQAFHMCYKLKTVIMQPTAAPTLGETLFTDEISQVVYYPSGATGYDGTSWADTKIRSRLVSNAVALASLTLNAGTLTPAFTPATGTYAAAVGNIPSLTVTPTSGNVETITVNGTAVTSGNGSEAIVLSEGANVITVVATDETSHNTKTYTITVAKTSNAPPASWNGTWDNLTAGIGFNYGADSHLLVTMPTTDGYYTYGTATGSTVTQTAVNQDTLPASGWNWNVKYHSVPVNDAYYTLTLKDAAWTSNFADGDALMTRPSLNLELEGDNSIISTAERTAALLPYPNVSLTIQGSGNLNAVGKSTSSYFYAPLTLNCSGTITMCGEDTAGIVGCPMTIKQGTVIGTSNYKVFYNVPAVPDFTDYAHYSLSVSTEKAGSAPTLYDASKNDSFKYFKVKPGVQHTITLDSQGGTGSPASVTTEFMGNLSSLPADPTKANCTFDGWFTEASGGTKVDTNTFFAEPTTIHAQWTMVPGAYTITFDSNGGTTVDPIVTGPDGKLASMPADPTKAGFNFAGWFTAASGGVEVTTATVFDKATTIFARWTAVPPVTAYTITFDYQGGTGTPGSGVTDGAGKLASLPVASRAGYTFDGWFTAASGGVEVTTATVFDKATTIFARWTAVPPVPPVDGGYVPPKKPVIVDGKTVNIGTEKKSGSTTTLTPDQKRLTAEIGKAKDKGSVMVSLSENTTAVARLMVKNVEDMAAKNMTLSVKTGGIRYDLPTAAMDVKALADAFPGVDTAKIPFDVTIKESGVTVKDAAVTATPTEFIITATSGDKTVATDRFSVFVDRAFEITKAQSEKITTAVVVEPDGKLRHVPTFVYETNGKYYAIVKSMTNSVYALIQNETTFPDVKGKWYEDVANEVGSRKIVMGTDKGIFSGDEKITRAEFAAMIVRALGLPTDKTGTFTDVPRDAWYAGSVATAAEYGLAQGIGAQKFNPMGLITREEAYQMLYNAAKRTGFPKSLAARNLSAEFSDLAAVGDWAKESVTWCLNQNLTVNLKGAVSPTEEITRGEMSALILKLLQRSELVDVRSKF